MTAEQFERLVKEATVSIDNYCKRYGGSDWQDLRQEALIKAWENRESYQQNKRFSSWVIQIAKNVSIDWNRTRGRRPQVMNMEHGVDDMAVDFASWQDCAHLDAERAANSASPRIQEIIERTWRGESLDQADRSLISKWRLSR